MGAYPHMNLHLKGEGGGREGEGRREREGGRGEGGRQVVVVWDPK